MFVDFSFFRVTDGLSGSISVQLIFWQPLSSTGLQLLLDATPQRDRCALTNELQWGLAAKCLWTKEIPEELFIDQRMMSKRQGNLMDASSLS
jgi:hypothetical protein